MKKSYFVSLVGMGALCRLVVLFWPHGLHMGLVICC